MMIIFDLDGTLADCEHRRHFVDVYKNPEFVLSHVDSSLPKWEHKNTKEKWKPDWKSFYEACDKDTPIQPIIEMFRLISVQYDLVEIWSGRCESVRDKTVDWLAQNMKCGNEHKYFSSILKMRPIGNTEPDEVLKERWLDQLCASYNELSGRISQHHHGIEFVFDDRPKVVRMWRSRGIFVFNCLQNDEEF